jgi:hypothetical protein
MRGDFAFESWTRQARSPELNRKADMTESGGLNRRMQLRNRSRGSKKSALFSMNTKEGREIRFVLGRKSSCGRCCV